MTKDERFDKVWAKYRSLNREGKIPAKVSFLKSEKRYLKANEGKTEDDFVEHVLFKISERERYNGLQEKAQQFVPSWPMAKTYFNNDRWGDDFVDTSSSELKEIVAGFKCFHCQTKENITRINKDKFVCPDCRWEHYSGETKNMLRKALEKAKKQMPKNKEESWHQYHSRYVAFVGKQSFARLPYNPQYTIANNAMTEEQAESLVSDRHEINDDDKERAERNLKAGALETHTA